MQNRPVEGVHYPGSLADIRAWFPDDEACLDYLDWLRWREGFVCPHCQDVVAWRLPDGRHSCGGCRRRVSVTAGTIFHRTRTPLTVWFEAAWLLTSQKSGASALGLQRVLSLRQLPDRVDNAAPLPAGDGDPGPQQALPGFADIFGESTRSPERSRSTRRSSVARTSLASVGGVRQGRSSSL
jgi:hypothetical protein